MALVSLKTKSFATNNNRFNLSEESECCYSSQREIPTQQMEMEMEMEDDNFSDHDVKMAFPLDEDHHDGSPLHKIKRKKLRRVFSRVLKGLLFPASSNSTRKKTRKNKGEETSPLSDNNVSTRIQKAFKLKKKKASPISSTGDENSTQSDDGSSSNSSSLFTSSSLSCSNSRSVSERKTTIDLDESNMMMKKKIKCTSLKKKYGDDNYNFRLYFLVICLVGLVFCGKAFAICCTSTCLLLFPSRSRSQVNHDFDFEPES